MLDDLKVPVQRGKREADAVTRHRARGRRRDPRAGVRADAFALGLRDLRLPDRVSGGGGVSTRSGRGSGSRASQ